MFKTIILIGLLFGQFVVTPERKEAMQKAGIAIRITENKITSLKTEQTNNDAAIVKLQARQSEIAALLTEGAQVKQDLITKAKTKLGLDNTWSWDDKTEQFIQKK